MSYNIYDMKINLFYINIDLFSLAHPSTWVSIISQASGGQ